MLFVSLDTANINAFNISSLDSEYGSILAAIGPHPTCRNWQMFLKCQSHSFTEIWSTLVNHSLIYNQGWRRPIPHMDNLNTFWDIHRDYWYDFCCMYRCLLLFKDSGSGLSLLGTNHIPQSLWNAIVDDDVEVAPIYRCRGKVEELRRPCKNLCIEQEAARLESHCNQPALAKGVPISGSLAPKAKILGTQ